MAKAISTNLGCAARSSKAAAITGNPFIIGSGPDEPAASCRRCAASTREVAGRGELCDL